MPDAEPPALRDILVRMVGSSEAEALLTTVELPPAVRTSAVACRAVLAAALALILFRGLLERVPQGRDYVDDQRKVGRRIVFDHGALRTVACPCGALPAGRAAFARLLEPLGYRRTVVYPLERISMSGHVYTQMDFPEDLPQYFVSELHPERFSPDFRAAVSRVVGGSRDPLHSQAAGHLVELAWSGHLPHREAASLVEDLGACFERQHDVPREGDYELLLAESAEMAWIATEGNAFNHATDRVPDLGRLAEEQRRRGRTVKERIEVSASGRIRQTALRAAPVKRAFRRPDGSTVMRTVPGSFFEFISRTAYFDAADGRTKLDLGFDSANAQGIFRMTSTAGKE